MTRLPAGVTREAAVALLQNHDFFLECNPHHISHKIKPPDVAASTAAKAKAHYKLPKDVEPLGSPPVKCYHVVDQVQNSTHNSDVQITDIESGIFVHIENKGVVVFDTYWIIRESPKQTKEGEEEEDSGLELVQDATMSAVTLILLNFVKGQVKKNRGGIHKMIVERLVKDRDEASGATTAAAANPTPASTSAETSATAMADAAATAPA